MAAHAPWFSSLPADELTPEEHQLRQALLKAMSAHDGPFPLGEWIDRRIGGEVETRRDENKNLEIFLRGSAGPPPASAPEVVSKEAFFEGLSPESFAPPEEALRDACFEFLASWRSNQLAQLRDLSAYPTVVRCVGLFLPKSVTLRDWIQHRIGGEIEFRKGPKGAEIVHLTDAARETVVAKYHQMAMAAAMPPPPPGHLGMPPHMGGPPPPAPPPRAPPPPAAAKGPDQAAWFAQLPADELLPGEMTLREALLNWLSGPRSGGHNPPQLSNTGSDPAIRRARAELFPKTVKFSDWIERRIGGEIELRNCGGPGQFEVYLRGSAPEEAVPEPVQVIKFTQEDKDAFFDALPQDEFAPEEEALREALLNHLDAHTGAEPALLGEAARDPEVGICRQALLPKGCPVKLQEWIDRRIGGELETRSDAPGRVIFGLRGMLPPAEGAKKNDGGAAKRRRM